MNEEDIMINGEGKCISINDIIVSIFVEDKVEE